MVLPCPVEIGVEIRMLMVVAARNWHVMLTFHDVYYVKLKIAITGLELAEEPMSRRHRAEGKHCCPAWSASLPCTYNPSPAINHLVVARRPVKELP
jgi:hypothetical protein